MGNTMDVDKLAADIRRHGGVKHKIGDVITGFITGIYDYGAFIENYDLKFTGLIHKSNIAKGVYISSQEDVERYFRLGDEVSAKIVDIRDGKYSLSTLEYELPTYGINPLGALIKRDEIKVVEKPSELDEIYEEMRGKVGGVSKSAHTRVAELVGKYGLVKFSMALSKALESYEPIDQSMLFVDEIEKQAGVKSPKRTFIISEHAKTRWKERGDGGDLMDRILRSKLMFEDIERNSRLYGDGEFVFPCAINDAGENVVKTVKGWGM